MTAISLESGQAIFQFARFSYKEFENDRSKIELFFKKFQKLIDEKIEGSTSFVEKLGQLSDKDFRAMMFISNEEGKFIYDRQLGYPMDQDELDKYLSAAYYSGSGILLGFLRNYYFDLNASILSEYSEKFTLQTIDHMLLVVANLKLDDIGVDESENIDYTKGVIRLLAIFHDIEKLFLLQSEYHPEIGASIFHNLFNDSHQLRTILSEEVIVLVSDLISIHHIVGRFFRPITSVLYQLSDSSCMRGDYEKLLASVGNFRLGDTLSSDDIAVLNQYLLKIWRYSNAHVPDLSRQTSVYKVLFSVDLFSQNLRLFEWLQVHNHFDHNWLTIFMRFVEADTVSTVNSDKSTKMIEEWLAQLKLFEFTIFHQLRSSNLEN